MVCNLKEMPLMKGKRCLHMKKTFDGLKLIHRSKFRYRRLSGFSKDWLQPFKRESAQVDRSVEFMEHIMKSENWGVHSRQSGCFAQGPMVRNQNNNDRPSSAMFLTILILWIGLNAYFADRYLSLVMDQCAVSTMIVAIMIVGWLILTTFFAWFHVVSFVFSFVLSLRLRPVPTAITTAPPVAIFYTCMNDMNPRSVTACLSQDYPDFAVCVLDDSTTAEERERIDVLKREYGEKLTIVRRATRKGFKAGNLNNALTLHGCKYKYFCVVDADEVIPSTFLRDLVSVAEAHKNVGFIQAGHAQYSDSQYGQLTGDGIDLHWSYFLPARNRFGFVHFYGHGALLSVKAVQSVGGFPEIVSEDIALAARLREAGYRGYFASHVRSLEESPKSYEAFRRRNTKILSGTLQFLVSVFPSFWKSPAVSAVEKIDMLVSASVMYLPLPFLGFLLTLNGSMFFMGVASQSSTTMHELSVLNSSIEPLCRWDGILLVLFTIFASLVYLIPSAIRDPRRVFSYALRMGAIHLSTCLLTTLTTCRWLVYRHNSFVPTGDRTHSVKQTGHADLIVGTIFTCLGLFITSIPLCAVGVSLMLAPLLVGARFDTGRKSLLLYVPVLLTILGICGTPIAFVAAAGVFASVGLIHH
ncbi:glycosyltransferase [bacterium]|nr:MAG: glycosyltransferase [bacterium]